jgi:hypothetical protein
MPSLHRRRGWLRGSATAALLLSALPLSLRAQIRRPDPVPTGPRAAASAPTRRTEMIKGGGFVTLDESNGTKATMFVGSTAYRRQVSPEWLYLGGMIDFGRTTIDGKFFPYEKRSLGDSAQFVQVDGHAMMLAARFTADAMTDVGESGKFRAGGGVNAGVYMMLPSPGGSSFVAPTFGASVIGEADLSARYGVMASIGFTQFLNFDREKLRPSDPALEDPVFVTPLVTPPAAVKSFGGARMTIGLTYRLGVKKIKKGAR